MKELPLLTQTKKIESGGGGGNFGAAFSQVAQADLQVAEFGANIAQSASSQRAKLAGIEAGQNPQGREPLVLTKTDAQYANAYNQQAMATLDFAGKKAIGDMFSTLAVNPTAEGMSLFKKSSLGEIDKLVNQAPKSLQPDLRRNLESTAQNNFYSLNSAFDAKQKKDRISLWKQSTDQNTNNISDLIRSGDYDGAMTLSNQTLQSSNEREQAGDIDKGTTSRLREVLDQTLYNGQAIYGLDSSSTPEKYLAELKNQEWVKKLPPHVQDAVIQNTVSYRNQTEAAQNAQQGINYTNYQTKIMSDEMTPTDWAQAEKQVDGGQFANLIQQQAKINIKQSESYADVAQYGRYLNNPSVMSGATPKTIDNISSFLLKSAADNQGIPPIDLTLADQMKALVGVHTPLPKLTGQHSAAFRSGSINEAVEAANNVSFAREMGNTEILSGLSDKDKMFANLLKEKSKSVDFEPKDFIDLREGIYNSTEEQRVNGLKAISDFKQKNKMNSFEGKMNFIKNALDVSNGWFRDETVLPIDIADTYDNLVSTYGVLTRDANKANELAIQELNNLYKETKVNGYSERMALAPNQFIPDVGHLIENTVKYSFASYVDRVTKAVSEGKLKDINIQWDERPKKGSPTDYENRWGEKGPITFKLNGREARLVIKTDGLTAASVNNEYTDYGVKMPNKNDKTWAMWYEWTDTPGASYRLPDIQTVKGRDGKEFNIMRDARFTPVEVEERLKNNNDIQKIVKDIQSKQLRQRNVTGNRYKAGS